MLTIAIKNNHILKVEFQAVHFGLRSAYPSLIFCGMECSFPKFLKYT